MAIALKKRRVATAKAETTRGSAEALTAAADGIPMIRDATFEITPIQVERPTLRLSLTEYPDIYPGKATVRIRLLCEVAGRDTGFPTTIAHFARLLRGCGFNIWPGGDNVFTYKVSALTLDNGPLRHGETLAGTALGDSDNVAIGDGWSHDGGILTSVFVAEGAAIGTAAGTITSTRGSAETVFTINARSTAKSVAWSPNSNINAQVSCTIGLFTDGKAVLGKGCMGNVEFQFNHGDAVLAQFDMQGVLETYIDTPMPTDGYEGHKVPPTFLGTRLTLASTVNAPADTARYGTGGTAGFATEGSLNQVRLSSGNNVILQANSLDPNGIVSALITSRKPVGSFNPTEVASATEFDFIGRFVAGTPARLKILLGDTDHTDPSSQDSNTFDFLAPGVVFTGMADQDRDGINVWDASFDMTGGDYDSTLLGERPGQDNEFVIVHR